MRLSRRQHILSLMTLTVGLGTLLGFGFRHQWDRTTFLIFMRDHRLAQPAWMEVYKGEKLCQESFCPFCLKSHRPYLPWTIEWGKRIDRWDTELRYQLLENGANEWRSAGPDRLFDTPDDQYVHFRR